MRHAFIINPRAGKKDQTARIYAMADALREKHGLECVCLLTDRVGGAQALARKQAERGDEVRVYACGGDGTANEVCNGVAGFANAAMTVIPIGTGNDLLKNFGNALPKFSDAENLWNGDVRTLDLIECNGRLCLTIACSGVDARIAETVREFGSSPLLSGKGSYLASAAVHFLFRGIARRWTVWLDGEKLEGDFSLVSVCNGRFYGGGFTPVPQARMTDGVLQTILVRGVGKAAFARMFVPYSRGEWESLGDAVRVCTPKTVRIRADEEIVTCLDGECFRSREVVTTLSDRKIRFFGPAGFNPDANAK